MEFVLYLNEEEHVTEARRKRELRDSSNPLELDENLFVKNYRLNKEAFYYIFRAIDPLLKTPKISTSVPNILKISTVLRFFAQGCYQLGVGNENQVALAQSTTSIILKEVVDAMESLCAQWIRFDVANFEQTKLAFYQSSGFPGVIGCIDGTHIKLASIKKDIQHLYYNRKGFHSLNVMIVCDHNNKITYINAKHPGSTHDSAVFNLSALKSSLDELSRDNPNTWLLGDAGYPLKPYLITPFRSAAPGTPQSRFNTKHARVRCVVERTIGILKNRFRCLIGARALHYTPIKATQIVNVCAALHNICLFYKINIPHEDVEELENSDMIDDVQNEEDAANIRNRIMASLV